MARKLRLEYPGAIYHVMNRGDHREPIFRDDRDRQRFLATLGEACGKTGWQVHAWCLMGNHFHLVVETPNANLVVGMKWLLGVYTSRFNRRHKLFGHLFSGRYKSLIVDGSGNGYLRTVCDYVHLNPARAKLISGEQQLRDYPWSSFVEYLKSAAQRVAWLRVDRLLGEMRIPEDSEAGRSRFEQNLEQRRAEENGEDWRALRRGWCLGDEAFRQELLSQISERSGDWHYGPELMESAEAKAERWIAAELQRQGWSRTDLQTHRKGSEFKVRLASRLRAGTTMPLGWIAERLHMGTRGHLTHLLYRQDQAAPRDSNQGRLWE